MRPARSCRPRHKGGEIDCPCRSARPYPETPAACSAAGTNSCRGVELMASMTRGFLMPAPITSASTIRASAADASSAQHIESVAPARMPGPSSQAMRRIAASSSFASIGEMLASGDDAKPSGTLAQSPAGTGSKTLTSLCCRTAVPILAGSTAGPRTCPFIHAAKALSWSHGQGRPRTTRDRVRPEPRPRTAARHSGRVVFEGAGNFPLAGKFVNPKKSVKSLATVGFRWY